MARTIHQLVLGRFRSCEPTDLPVALVLRMWTAAAQLEREILASPPAFASEPVPPSGWTEPKGSEVTEIFSTQLSRLMHENSTMVGPIITRLKELQDLVQGALSGRSSMADPGDPLLNSTWNDRQPPNAAVTREVSRLFE